jgi:hypothetical protein
MGTGHNHSPAAKVMDEAIDLVLAGRSPYPGRAAFIDADVPQAGREIWRAADEGRAIVLVAYDGGSLVLEPESQCTDRLS